jgi:hypothetical protein
MQAPRYRHGLVLPRRVVKVHDENAAGISGEHLQLAVAHPADDVLLDLRRPELAPDVDIQDESGLAPLHVQDVVRPHGPAILGGVSFDQAVRHFGPMGGAGRLVQPGRRFIAPGLCRLLPGSGGIGLIGDAGIGAGFGRLRLLPSGGRGLR